MLHSQEQFKRCVEHIAEEGEAEEDVIKAQAKVPWLNIYVYMYVTQFPEDTSISQYMYIYIIKIHMCVYIYMLLKLFLLVQYGV